MSQIAKFVEKDDSLTNLGVPEALVDAALVLAVGRVKVIFDAVVGASRKFFCDVCPFVSQLFVQVKNLFLLNLVNWSLIDVRVQVVVPPAKRDSFIPQIDKMLTFHGTAFQFLCEF